MIAFTLSKPTPTLNNLLRMHFRRQVSAKRALAYEVGVLTAGRRPAAPWPRARIEVTRRAVAPPPDRDNAYAGLKHLLDVLQPLAPTRKYGLGVILSDAPDALEIELRCERCRKGESGTDVRVFPLPAEVPHAS